MTAPSVAAVIVQKVNNAYRKPLKVMHFERLLFNAGVTLTGGGIMQQIVPPIRIVQKILGVQKAENGASYRLSTHCMCLERLDGALLYHTMTGELLLLSHDEAALLEELPGSVPVPLRELATRWFLRPLGADDMAMADQVREIAKHFLKREPVLKRYTVITTTDCNARCYYCYEGGWKKTSMSEQTALDTANYIAMHCGGKSVQFRWFGGEPLVNTRAIDIITDSLRQRGVEFHSTMTSNGYLFDEALVQRARDAWNLEMVQITLDGTEEVYNRRKAYVNSKGSPFQRVMRNIGLLLDAGILVKVRLNMDRDNENDLYMLLDELAECFAGKSGLGIYPMVLLENAGINPPSYTEDERRTYVQKLDAMRAYAERKGIESRGALSRSFVLNACLADDSNSTTVTPDGHLGRCQACKDGAIWGSIYSDEVNEEVLQQWKEHAPAEPSCKTCVVYPQCVRVKRCPSWSEHCTIIERSARESMIRRAVLGSYENWKAAGGE